MTCLHRDRVEGVCTTCGHCLHEVILNGACFLCGSTDLAQLEKKPSKPTLIEPETLIRKK